MRFTKRDDILLAWDKGDEDLKILWYIPLMQSASIDISTNIASRSLSGTYQKLNDVVTGHSVNVSLEMLGSGTLINEEIPFLNTPTSTETQLLKDINEPLNLLVILNDTDDDGSDLIEVIEKTYPSYSWDDEGEKVEEGEKFDRQVLKVYRCFMNSYSFSVEAGGIATHKLDLTGENIDGKTRTIGSAENTTNLKPSQFGVAKAMKIFSGDVEFDEPVTDFSLEVSIDRKKRYTFLSGDEEPSKDTNYRLSPLLNDAESSAICNVSFSTVYIGKKEEFSTVKVRETASMMKNFSLRLFQPESGEEEWTDKYFLNFYNAMLTSVSVSETIDGRLGVNYKYSIEIPTKTTSGKVGITTKTSNSFQEQMEATSSQEETDTP